ncbi:hypothetical protein RA19_02625 [Leisingera sp. ANG-M1]|nr:hypothetical protein RA19_02625 [Leisingera sp. ANG-M1]
MFCIPIRTSKRWRRPSRRPGQHGRLAEEARIRISGLVAGLLGEEPERKLRRIVATGSAYEQIL